MKTGLNKALIKERNDERKLFLNISRDIAAVSDKDQLSAVLRAYFERIGVLNHFNIYLFNESIPGFQLYLSSLTGCSLFCEEFADRERSFKDLFFNEEIAVFNLTDFLENMPGWYKAFNDAGIHEIITSPIHQGNIRVGSLLVFLQQATLLTDLQFDIIEYLADLAGIAITNIETEKKRRKDADEINYYKSVIEQENIYLHEQIKTTVSDDLIGSDVGLKEVSRLVSRVAGSDTSVLILGETGTGKELVARAVHNQSPRKEKLLVKVNCAALPASLIESELFGHEKGSFTGATDRRIGKFELANKGTLFLDEIGELPVELQVKLLRALQEKEIERIGGKETIKTDVRIIAATNRNLEKEVLAGRFRSDLYYRLNVFPITIPPLRDRAQDIPVLATYFVNKMSEKLGRKTHGIWPDAMAELKNYHWPGNVRELEHVIERSAIMADKGAITDVFLSKETHQVIPVPIERVLNTNLDDSEREYIKTVLKHCDGRVKGDGGAAIVLGLPATTLYSKMKKLGIKKTDYCI
jgi:formate hydrogenlyase transcriptional activator